MSHETCERVAEAEPYFQGDIFKRFDVAGSESYWVLISADCDIAQEKLREAGFVCVQLTPFEDYLLNGHLRAQLVKAIVNKKRKLQTWILARWSQLKGESAALSEGRVDDWLMQASVDEISAVLEIEGDGKVEAFGRSLTALRSAAADLQLNATESFVKGLIALSDQAIGDEKKYAASVISRARDGGLPDDLFFITAVPDESPKGFVADLRRLAFFQIHEIALTVPDARTRTAAYVRIARLSPTFKHGLAQQFGFLFSRIGYSTAYEAARDETIRAAVGATCDKYGARGQ